MPVIHDNALANSILQRVLAVGEGVLHTLFPKDQEAYFILLELINSLGATVQAVLFPVLPRELREEHVELTNISTTYGGTHTLRREGFTPRTITMEGQFDRSIRLAVPLIGFSSPAPESVFVYAPRSLQTESASTTPRIPATALTTAGVARTRELSGRFKRGYGIIKLFEEMKELSKFRDVLNRPYTLILYNPVLGNNYIVEFNSFSHMQNNRSANRLPSYKMQFTATDFFDTGILRRAGFLLNRTIQNGINRFLADPLGTINRLGAVGRRASRNPAELLAV